MSIIEHKASNAEQLAEDLAHSLADQLRAALKERGEASIAVSGGSTPLPLFHRLRTQDLDWSQVTVTLADERWVDSDHKDSNEAFVRRELLQDKAAVARFISLKNDAPSPEKGEDACEQALNAFSWPLDVIILGMGGDGHTASLFPALLKHPHALRMGLDLEAPAVGRCIAIHPAHAPHPRLSLTLKALLETRRLILHITGDNKWQVYQNALEEGPTEELPIRGVLRQDRLPLEVYWAP